MLEGQRFYPWVVAGEGRCPGLDIDDGRTTSASPFLCQDLKHGAGQFLEFGGFNLGKVGQVVDLELGRGGKRVATSFP